MICSHTDTIFDILQTIDIARRRSIGLGNTKLAVEMVLTWEYFKQFVGMEYIT